MLTTRPARRRARAVRAAAATAAAVLALGLAQAPASAAGGYDPTFAGAGRSVVGGGEYRLVAVAAGPTDALVTVGIRGAAEQGQVDVRKLTPTGLPDPTFAGDGDVQTGAGLDWSIPAVAIDAHTGLIYVSAYAPQQGLSRVWRYTATGIADPAWGGNGVVQFQNSRFSDLQVDDAGRVLVTNGTAIYRLATNGAVDTSFGVSGGVSVATGVLDGLEILGDGDILAVGRGADTLEAFRINGNGTVDSGFGTQGKANFAITPPLGWTVQEMSPTTLAVQNDGRVVVAGGVRERNAANGNTREALLVMRFTKGGSQDNSFFVHRDYPLNISGMMAVQGNDKILVPVTGGGHAGIVRLDRNGKLDPAFGTGGSWGDTTQGSRPTAITVQRAGRIVATGWAPGTGGLLWGLTGDAVPTCMGKLATAFGGSGKDTLLGTDGNDVIVAGAGKDTIKGGPGKDRICAGGGDDRVEGGGGNDKIDGGSGSDKLWGNAGKDKIKGGPGNDVLKGGSGKDTLKGGTGRDKIDGGPGKDKIKQ